MSQYSRASVLQWLSGVSSTSSPPTQKGNKIRREPLIDRSPNIMNILPRSTPSPTKRRKLNQKDLDDDNIEITPRPLRSLDSGGHDGSQQISSSASSGAQSPRSRSPTKQMAALVFAPEPLLFKQFSPEVARKFPAGLIDLLKAIERFSKGIGVISNTHQVCASCPGSYCCMHRITDFWSKAEVVNLTDAAYGAIDDFTFTQSGKLPGPSPTPQQCTKAMWLAKRCEERRCCEAAWNSSVHNYVLDLAIHHDEFLNKVYFLNCFVCVLFSVLSITDSSTSTSARIQPTSLIPPGKAGTAINSKMVDFVIHVEPSDRFSKAVHARAQLKPKQMSVNHTFHEPLCSSPIGVSIETKHTGQNWNDAMMQVGVWVAAQFARMEQLVSEANEISEKAKDVRDDPKNQLPFLPIIIIQGHDWHFLAAIRDPGKQTVRVRF